MSNTYTLLESITVGAAGASSVTFNSIPQTGYTDLVVKASTRSGSGAAVAYSMLMKINSLTSSIYSQRAAEGNGAAASSFNQSGIDSAVRVALVNGTGATASTFSSTEITIPNYASSNYKSVSIDSVAETNATTTYMNMLAYLVQTTDAVSSLTFAPESAAATFAQYSTFSLYGVSALGTTPTKAPKATGGDTIMTDGTYWIHTFINSGTFTPATALSVDYLVVAGGGGGGQDIGGGAGAGGYKTSIGGSPLSLSSATNYTVTIGAGGAGGNSAPRANGANGSNSVFSSITSTGGGFGTAGGASGFTGGSGGSGGGAGGTNGASPTNAIGTASPIGQGNDGGLGNDGGSGSGRGGGGGGASAVGASGTASGNGGAGSANSITGSSVTYAGGGGGGSYETTVGAGGAGGGGGGGRYAPTTTGTAGTANTGGGGGGGSAGQGIGGAGGSGVVIIRYLA